ncbi:MAG TPA: hypothetical protein VJR46_11210 [Candidatus Dormibacteraeota bacterium]|nr:hypothetical protein [Candidatus Dormibacteraeota bacterium]
MDLVLPEGIDRLPRHHRRLLAACEMGFAEPDVAGMAIAGSFVDGRPDEYSDVDLRLVLAEGSLDRVFARKVELARQAGPLVAFFTGEHVGEPQLLVTLYADLVHVDYLFMELWEAAEKNNGRQTLVLWQRDPRVTQVLSQPYVADVPADLAYLEARIWTWAWYIQSKILRGELWEAVSGLNTVRDVVLFRLFALARDVRFRGARFAEELVGERRAAVELTQARVDRESLQVALRATVSLYLELADPLLMRYGVQPNEAARKTVMPALEAGPAFVPPPA